MTTEEDYQEFLALVTDMGNMLMETRNEKEKHELITIITPVISLLSRGTFIERARKEKWKITKRKLTAADYPPNPVIPDYPCEQLTSYKEFIKNLP